jgi:hypothetical protein
MIQSPIEVLGNMVEIIYLKYETLKDYLCVMCSKK